MTSITAAALFASKSMVKMRKNERTPLTAKFVKSLDSIPWNKRQWGHALARNAINSKQKLGLALSNTKIFGGEFPIEEMGILGISP